MHYKNTSQNKGFIQKSLSFLSRSFNKYWLIVSYNNHIHSLNNSKTGFRRKIDWDAEIGSDLETKFDY